MQSVLLKVESPCLWTAQCFQQRKWAESYSSAVRGGGGEQCAHCLAHILNGPEFFTLGRSEPVPEPCPVRHRTLPPFPHAVQCPAVLTGGSRIGYHSNSKVNKTAAKEISLGEGERHLEALAEGMFAEKHHGYELKGLGPHSGVWSLTLRFRTNMLGRVMPRSSKSLGL